MMAETKQWEAAFDHLKQLTASIRDAGDDWEMAHIHEDRLMKDALTICAKDHSFAGNVARLALHLLKEFEGDGRWYS